MERDAFREVLGTKDARAGVEAFLDGEKPSFSAPDVFETRSTLTNLRLEAGVTQSPYYLRRQRQARVRRIRRITFISLLLGLILIAIASAIVYAGSPGTLAEGIRVDGVDVGGLSQAEARAAAEAALSRLAREARDLHRGGAVVRAQGESVGLTSDWAAAVAAARHKGDGFGPLRGLRRAELRLFGGDVAAQATYSKGALKREVGADREGRRPASSRGQSRPARAARVHRSGPRGSRARPRRRGRRDRRRARVDGARRADRAPDQGRRAEGDRADAAAGAHPDADGRCPNPSSSRSGRRATGFRAGASRSCSSSRRTGRPS